ncbi:MAG TPA: Mut7-C RNAse domain-containing protein [Deltaproteobacteria bacterium]|nr:Mut7-C RNAse domain-containing protein [Deltaproteobacteria bacterium]
MTFLCDQNLGRLARWLRMMGFDARYMRVWDEDTIRDAIEEGRIFLTRKRSLAFRQGVLVMESDHLDDQIAHLGMVLGLGDKIEPFSRCSICNLPLKCVKRVDVEKQVPEYVYATHDEFARCPGCSRIYWRGTQPARSLERIRSLMHKDKRG